MVAPISRSRHQRNDPRYWLWFSVVAGLGLQEKYSIALFGFGMVVGLLLTGAAARFRQQMDMAGRKWPRSLIFLPNLLWNVYYDWPFVQLMRGIRG